MNKTVVVLVGLATLIAPAIPSLAQGQQDQASEKPSFGCEDASFDGEHWTLAADPGLPGAVDVTLNRSNATLAEEIRLPGEELNCRVDEDRVRLSTDAGELRVRDRAELRLGLETDDARAAMVLASGVAVEDAGDGDDDRYRLTVENGPTLILAGENVTLDGDTLSVAGEAELFRERTGDDRTKDADARSGDGSGASARGSGEDNRSDERGDRERDRDRDRDRGPDRPTVTEGNYSVGAAELRLANDTLREVQWRNATVFDTVRVSGLTPAEERLQGPHLRLDGDDARVQVSAAGGLMARLEADAGIEADVADAVEVRQEGESLFLSTDNVLLVVQGDELSVDNGTIEAEELRLHARTPKTQDSPVWRGEDVPEGSVELPYAFEGRHVSFDLEEDRVGNLSIHGTPVGEVTFDTITLEELDRRGANLRAEGEDFELRLQDTPAVQLRLEATNLSADLPANTTLPSGAHVHTQVEGDELRLRVERPADALSNETSVEHRPASQPVERSEGPQPGLQTQTGEGQLGVTSSSPRTITTTFNADAQGLDGNVSLQLGLARAMLVEDTNGNDRVDVGEPAIAERPLTESNVSIEGDELVYRFPLWSGQLTVTVEPGNETAKVTYIATNLSAPPGSLFVLETSIDAPADANLTPTDTGVVVDNGTMSAEYSATGPVTVDGEEAWAQRSIFVDGDDRVRMLVSYPAGDNITHDPTVSVQSSAAEVAQRLAASPYAIAVGVGLAGLLVAGTVLHRRRRRP